MFYILSHKIICKFGILTNSVNIWILTVIKIKLRLFIKHSSP